jgi:uncharacterized protein (TIGR02271 family)
MTHTVVGLFDDRSEAQAAMQQLVQHGFIRENIDLSNRSTSDATSTSTSASTTNSTTGTEGVGDSISNFFSSLFGGDETTVNNYTNAASEADAILAVQVDSAERAAEAADILDSNGAIDVDERAAGYNQQNFSGATENTSGNTTAARNTANLQETASIPVIEEELQVGKREVETGGARVRSRIIEKPVEASVRLREEHVVVNRRPVNRAVTDADMANFSEGEIALTERSEVPVVAKQARVVEEVEVGKQVSEREETVRDTVRRTDVEVDETTDDATDNVTNINSRRAAS